MPRRVKINKNFTTLPNGRTYDAGDEVVLTDDQYEQIAPGALGDEVADLGHVDDPIMAQMHEVFLPRDEYVAPTGGGGGFKFNADSTAIIPEDNADSWIVGSDRMGRDPADTTKNGRAFFNKTKGAFRAGLVQGAEWDDANVGFGSHAEGFGTTASGSYSHAEGALTAASGHQSHAEGTSTTASASNSHAEGQGSKATNTGAHGEGVTSTASGYAAHAEGYTSTASGQAAHAEGKDTTASGNYSHAQGEATKAPGIYAHAEGVSSEATASVSRAEGAYAVASRYAQRAKASGMFAVLGDAQVNEFVARRQTTDATPSVLTFINGAVNLSGGATSVLTLAAVRAHKVRIEAVARRTDVQGEMAGFSWEGLVGRDSTGNARIIGTPVTNKWNDAGAAAWTLTVGVNTTDATNNYLEILATGEAGKMIRWVASIETVEVAG